MGEIISSMIILELGLLDLQIEADLGEPVVFNQPLHGGGPQKLDSVLSSDSYPEWRIRDEQEKQEAQCPIQG
jgi:hypothetical protein